MARLRLQAPVRRPSSKDAQDPVNIQNIWDFNELKYKGRQILLLRTKVCGTSVLFLHLLRYSGFKDKKTLASSSYCLPSQLLPTQHAPWTAFCMHVCHLVCFHKCLLFVVMQILHHCQNKCATTWHIPYGEPCQILCGLLKNTCNFDGEMFFLFQNDCQLLNMDSKNTLTDFNLVNCLII